VDNIPTRSGVYRYVVRFTAADPRSRALLADAHALGLTRIHNLACHDLFFIKGSLLPSDLARLGQALLCDGITQQFQVEPLEALPIISPGDLILEVALRPGVTDPVAEQLVRAAAEIGIPGLDQVATGQRYLVSGDNLSEADLHLLAQRLLANDVIQRYALGCIQPNFPAVAQSSGAVEQIPLRNLTDDQLLALSQDRRAALNLPEMQAIQAWFTVAGRDPTDIEFEMLAQTWSEHCVHKTFKAHIHLGNGQIIPGLLRTYLRSVTEAIAAPWVLSAFVDNAGIIEYDGQHEVSFKVETHNHPSAIEPFGGANTGVGGVIRDVMGVSARPIAATDVLCFGPQSADPETLPAGVLHPRRIQSGVVAGVQDYGNKMGLPTVSGAIWYDPGFTANPLVFCGCVGLAPLGRHCRTPQSGDHVIVLGGRTGRDGLRGATFSSMTMDAQTGEVSGASVQIGNPIVEKCTADVLILARDAGLYHAVTDCGAGGLSSAVGEMAAECGADVDLQSVPLKYPGLAPWEIWLSEAQERMVLAVPPQNLPALSDLCKNYGVELTDLGVFTRTGRLIVRWGAEVVLDLDVHFLHDGIPLRHLPAVLPPEAPAVPAASHSDSRSLEEILLALLAHPNLSSREPIIRQYDHEVQGATVIKPLTGIHADAPSDACVLQPLETRGPVALALACGLNPEYGKLDPYRMACSALDEAVRNVVAVGADPDRIAVLDNFCWGNPANPETLGQLVAAARGCHDAALLYKTPFISGKDSLNNEYLGSDGLRHAIPPTLLISALGILPDVSHAVSMDLKSPGSRLYLVGQHVPHFGGSHFALIGSPLTSDLDRSVPNLPSKAPGVYHALHLAMTRHLVSACHDLSEGGLALAAAEMCIGGGLGLTITMSAGTPIAWLFGETNGCLLVEVPVAHAPAFESLFTDLPICLLGQVTAEPILRIEQAGCLVLAAPIANLTLAWKGAAL